MDYKTRIRAEAVHKSHTASFGVFDTKGREFGAAYTVGSEVYDYATEQEVREQWCYRQAPGTWFYLRRSSLRGGKAFGAHQGTLYYRTLAEALAAAEKYLEGARKRAMTHKDRAGEAVGIVEAYREAHHRDVDRMRRITQAVKTLREQGAPLAAIHGAYS